MYSPPPGQDYIEPNIFVQGKRLNVVDTFIYLGSSIARDGSLDSEVQLRIAKACKAFGALEKRVWSDRGITIKTKLSVYESCVLTSLLYSSETWTTYRRHIQVLERFHQKCLRRILNIKWQSLTPDTIVLQQANTTSVEMILIRNQMRWAGHVTRMDDKRLPKQIFYGELLTGARPPYKPRMRFKDVIKHNLKELEIDDKIWETLSENRSVWRKMIFDGCKSFEKKRTEHSNLKRALRKQDTSVIPENDRSNHICNTCDRVCLSKAGLVCHQRSHGNPLPQHPEHHCLMCEKVCKSSAGLKRHMIIHENVSINIQHNAFSCHRCKKLCKSKAGLKSHLRAHRGASIN